MGDREDALRAGREASERHAWSDACRHLLAASEAEDRPLARDDLDRLATAAYLTGRYGTAEEALEQLHRSQLEAGDVDAAARSAVWLAIQLFLRGRHAQGGGWLALAGRLLDEADLDCAARGYLLVPVALQALDVDHDPDRAEELFRRASSVADRFGDGDLALLGLLGRGQSLVTAGEVGPGLRLLDELLVALTTTEGSPIVAGIAYCAAIITCRAAFDLRRAQEWTDVLSRWCGEQQGLRPFRGQCLVHRSELLRLHGDWTAATAEIEEACAHLDRAPGDPVVGMARYQQAELERLRGRFARAEECYRRADAAGHTPQPGLALLRLAEGRTDDALAAIERELALASDDRLRRAQVLAAYVEIVLAVGDLTAASAGVDDLEQAADELDSSYLRAVAWHARGAVLLATGDPTAASAVLRRAKQAWYELDAPYERARARLLVARACRQLGDHDSAEVELDAASDVLRELGAAPALGEADRLTRGPGREAPGGLTARELEVLRIVAAGATNREVAETLVISEKTVARHLSNTFAKLGVGSRVAAAAWAHRHDLV